MRDLSVLSFLGMFPLSDTSLMTAEEKRQFLPVARTFTSILQKDNIDAEEMNLLLDQSRELTNRLAQSNQNGNNAGFFGGLGGSGGFSGLGRFSGLGGLPSIVRSTPVSRSGGLTGLSNSGRLSGLSGLGGLTGFEGFNRPGRNAAVGGSGRLGGLRNSGNFNEFLLPETGDHIVNVPGQGPSFNTALGKINSLNMAE